MGVSQDNFQMESCNREESRMLEHQSYFFLRAGACTTAVNDMGVLLRQRVSEEEKISVDLRNLKGSPSV